MVAIRDICKRILLDNIPLKHDDEGNFLGNGKRILLDNIPLKRDRSCKSPQHRKRILLDNIPLKLLSDVRYLSFVRESY